MESNEFGIYLRELRKKKKMKIRQLELYSGVSNAYLSQLENGKRGIPSPDILRKLAKPLGVEYEELMQKAGHLKKMTEEVTSQSETTKEIIWEIVDRLNIDITDDRSKEIVEDLLRTAKKFVDSTKS